MGRLATSGIFAILPFLCNCGDQLVGWPVDDDAPPTVLATSPEDRAVNVALHAPINATFSEVMDPSRLDAASFTLRHDATLIPGTLMYLGASVLFTPAFDLEPHARYTASITTGVTDLAGNAMAADYSWSFEMGAAAEAPEVSSDATRPQVTSTVPSDGAQPVARGTPLTATFSEVMNPLTVTAASFTLLDGATPMWGDVTYFGVTATFHPSGRLAADTTYLVRVDRGAADRAGNELAEDYVWSFRTGAVGDTSRPTVISSIPAARATEVVLDASLSATFSEVMAPLTLAGATFSLREGAESLAGSVTQIGATLIFDPARMLHPDTEYLAIITALATDLAGNALASDFVWRFTTGSELDPGAPWVSLTNPADLTRAVPVDALISVTFGEAMDPMTITTATFTVMAPDGRDLPGTVQYDMASSIATFTPDGELLSDSIYLATIATGATDLAGNALENAFAWSFTTSP